MLHLVEQEGERNMVLAALRALADHYVANSSRFAGDGGHDPSGRQAIQGVAKRGQYVGFLRNTVEAIFKARKWSVTAVLDKLSATGALLTTEKDRHTKKVCGGGVQHRMVCVKWPSLLPDDRLP